MLNNIDTFFMLSKKVAWNSCLDLNIFISVYLHLKETFLEVDWKF